MLSPTAGRSHAQGHLMQVMIRADVQLELLKSECRGLKNFLHRKDLSFILRGLAIVHVKTRALPVYDILLESIEDTCFMNRRPFGYYVRSLSFHVCFGVKYIKT